MTIELLPGTYGDVDASRVRSQFPALEGGATLLDAPSGTQLPRSVSDAIHSAMVTAVSNQGGPYPASYRADEIVLSARRAVADLVGGDPRGVVFGPSTTALAFRFAETLSWTWGAGDNIVVSELDHDANIRPWVLAAGRRGIEVRWSRVDPVTCELPAAQYEHLVDDRTRLVAVTGASNLAGTRPDISAISAIAHARGALVFVDGVHLTAHIPIDVAALGADFYATSAYKWCGPHLAAVAADPDLLESLDQAKLVPATPEVPERFEWGTPQFETLAGITAAVDFIAGVVPADSGTRRGRLLNSMAAVEVYEDQLAGALRRGLADAGATLVGGAASRTPTVPFVIPGFENQRFAEGLGERGVGINWGNHYALELVRALGLDEKQGVLRAGIAPYNTMADVEHLLEATIELVRQ